MRPPKFINVINFWGLRRPQKFLKFIKFIKFINFINLIKFIKFIILGASTSL